MTRGLLRTTLAAGTLAGTFALAATPAMAEERVCRGTIGAQTVNNLRVPEGALQSFENSRPQAFSRNRIDGNMQCTENVPAPVGGRNVVGGDKEDQCAPL